MITLTKIDRAFLHGESAWSRGRLPAGREAELRELCDWAGEWRVKDTLTLVVVKTPDGKLWAYRQHVLPGEDNWYDDEPLFEVVAKKVAVTTYTLPNGEEATT